MWKDQEAKVKAQKIISDFLNGHVTKLGIHYSLSTVIGKIELVELSKGLLRSEVLNGLVQMQKEGKTDIQDFERIIHLHRKKPKEKWKIFIPLPNALNIPKRKFSLLGQKFEIRSIRSIRKEIGNTLFYQQIPFKKIEPREISNDYQKYIVTTAQGKYFLEALRQVEPSYDLLRGIIDYIIHRKTELQISSLGRAKTRFPYPKTIFACSKDDNEYLDLSHIGQYEIRYSFTQNDKKIFESLLNKLKLVPPDSHINSLIVNTFILFGNAMDAIFHHQVFLNFWQLAENICFSEESRGGTKTVKNRMEIHVNNEYFLGKSADGIFEYFSKLRNDIVHRGIKEVDSDDVAVLDFFCKEAISWLLDISEYLKSKQQLEIYYKRQALSDSELTKMETESKDSIQVMNLIKRQRKFQAS